MKKEELKIGDTVKAVFRKYGRHLIYGEVTEISTDEHALDGTWVGIKVTGGDRNDKVVNTMIWYKHSVLVPVKDVLEVLK